MALHSSWAFILFPQVLLQTGEKLSTYFDKQQINKRKKKFRTKEFCNTLSLNSDSLVSRFCFQSFMHFIILPVIFSLCSFWEIDLNRHLYRPNEHLAIRYKNKKSANSPRKKYAASITLGSGSAATEASLFQMWSQLCMEAAFMYYQKGQAKQDLHACLKLFHPKILIVFSPDRYGSRCFSECKEPRH